MQYWKPESENEFAGDMMPFWGEERFHLFYLLDRNHHAEQGGLGGHQWAHAATLDLKEWQHYPLALPKGELGAVDENGICTGSIFEHAGVYHAFYATRLRRPDGSVYEAICRAVSRDLIHFDKSPHNPLFPAPPGLDPNNHRDPCVFQEAATGVYHMVVTASGAACGVLAHYTSEDLAEWHYQGLLLPPGDHHAPECPEHFYWNGWWYLLYSRNQQMQYWIARKPLGPWQRASRKHIEGRNLVVPRTASFGSERRLAVGFLQWRRDSRDEGDYQYAGNTVFRELLQDEDGTLWTHFVPEMMPPTGPPLHWQLLDDATVKYPDSEIHLQADAKIEWATIAEVPADCIITFEVTPESTVGEYGLLLRADENLEVGYCLCFMPQLKCVTLQRWPDDGRELRAVVKDVDGFDTGVSVIICMKDSIIDVSINGRHTLIERCFNHKGTHLGCFVRDGEAHLQNLVIAPIIEP